MKKNFSLFYLLWKSIIRRPVRRLRATRYIGAWKNQLAASPWRGTRKESSYTLAVTSRTLGNARPAIYQRHGGYGDDRPIGVSRDDSSAAGASCKLSRAILLAVSRQSCYRSRGSRARGKRGGASKAAGKPKKKKKEKLSRAHERPTGVLPLRETRPFHWILCQMVRWESHGPGKSASRILILNMRIRKDAPCLVLRLGNLDSWSKSDWHSLRGFASLPLHELFSLLPIDNTLLIIRFFFF